MGLPIATAKAICAEHGLELQFRDITNGTYRGCIVEAVSATGTHKICNLTRYCLMGAPKFRQLIETIVEVEKADD